MWVIKRGQRLEIKLGAAMNWHRRTVQGETPTDSGEIET